MDKKSNEPMMASQVAMRGHKGNKKKKKTISSHFVAQNVQ